MTGNESWIKIANAARSEKYNAILDKKTSEILNGGISSEQLKNNSIFSGKLECKAEENFAIIAGLNRDKDSVDEKELKVLLALTDAELEDDGFHFDGNFDIK